MAKWRVLTLRPKGGKLIVAKDKRITVKHVREMEAAGLSRLEVPEDFLLGRALAKNIVDTSTGEVVASANDEITEEVLAKLRAASVQSFETIYTNDLDQGPYTFADAENRRDGGSACGAGGDLSHDASRGAAYRGRGEDALQRAVLLCRAL